MLVCGETLGPDRPTCPRPGPLTAKYVFEGRSFVSVAVPRPPPPPEPEQAGGGPGGSSDQAAALSLLDLLTPDYASPGTTTSRSGRWAGIQLRVVAQEWHRMDVDKRTGDKQRVLSNQSSFAIRVQVEATAGKRLPQGMQLKASLMVAPTNRPALESLALGERARVQSGSSPLLFSYPAGRPRRESRAALQAATPVEVSLDRSRKRGSAEFFLRLGDLALSERLGRDRPSLFLLITPEVATTGDVEHALNALSRAAEGERVPVALPYCTTLVFHAITRLRNLPTKEHTLAPKCTDDDRWQQLFAVRWQDAHGGGGGGGDGDDESSSEDSVDVDGGGVGGGTTDAARHLAAMACSPQPLSVSASWSSEAQPDLAQPDLAAPPHGQPRPAEPPPPQPAVKAAGGAAGLRGTEQLSHAGQQPTAVPFAAAAAAATAATAAAAAAAAAASVAATSSGSRAAAAAAAAAADLEAAARCNEAMWVTIAKEEGGEVGEAAAAVGSVAGTAVAAVGSVAGTAVAAVANGVVSVSETRAEGRLSEPEAAAEAAEEAEEDESQEATQQPPPLWPGDSSSQEEASQDEMPLGKEAQVVDLLSQLNPPAQGQRQSAKRQQQAAYVYFEAPRKQASPLQALLMPAAKRPRE